MRSSLPLPVLCEQLACGIKRSIDAGNILAASLRHGGLTATAALDLAGNLLDYRTSIEALFNCFRQYLAASKIGVP